MIRFGYRSEEERYQPSVLVENLVVADRLGFDFACVADHFHPWFHKDGAGGQAWIVIGTAAALTSRITLGTSITAPIYRYHPGIVAQSFATLGQLFPARIFLGLGTGEAMNEVPLGFDWADYETRRGRLEESVTIIRRLWLEDFVSHDGKYYKLRGANLYTKPTSPIPLYVAASGTSSARLAGRLADGLIAGVQVRPDLAKAKKLLESFESAARDAGRDPGAMRRIITIHLSYDRDYERARQSLRRWSVQGSDRPGLSKFFSKDVHDPRTMDAVGARVDLEKFSERWLVTTDLEEVTRAVEDVVECGFDGIEIFSVSPDEPAFLKEFGSRCLPYLQENYRNR